MEKLKGILSNKRFLIISCFSILVILIATLIMMLVSSGDDKEKENSSTTTTTTNLIETEVSISIKDDKTNVEVVYTGITDSKDILNVKESEVTKELKKQSVIRIYDIKLFDENNQEIINKENTLIKIPFDNETTKYNSFIATKIVNNEMSNSIDAYYDETSKVVYFYTNDLGTYGIVAKKVDDKNMTTTKKITTTRKATTTKKDDVTTNNTTASNKKTTTRQEDNTNKKWKITLYSPESRSKVYKIIEVENNKTAAKPKTPILVDGKYVLYWTYNNIEFDFNTKISQNYDLYPVYQSNSPESGANTTKEPFDDAPTNLYATNLDSNNYNLIRYESLTISFDKINNNNVAGYHIYSSPTKDGNYTLLEKGTCGPVPDKEFCVNHNSSDTYYKIRAVSMDGEEGPLSEALFVPGKKYYKDNIERSLGKITFTTNNYNRKFFSIVAENNGTTSNPWWNIYEWNNEKDVTGVSSLSATYFDTKLVGGNYKYYGYAIIYYEKTSNYLLYSYERDVFLPNPK